LLWRLNLLGNIDKHRRIPINGHIAIVDFPDFPREFAHLIEADNDAEMVSIPLDLKSKMRFDPTGSLNITFGDSKEGISCDFGGLEDMYNFVADGVFPKFARFF
jgi:hypothetical protein